MKSAKFLFLGIGLALAAGCGKSDQAAAPTNTGVAAAAAQPTGREGDPVRAPADWLKMEDGNTQFLAKVVDVAEPVASDIATKSGGFDRKINCVQVVRPLKTQGDIVGTLEFLPEACEKGPIVVGTKTTAFVLALKKPGAVKPAPAAPAGDKVEAAAEGAKEVIKEAVEVAKDAVVLDGAFDIYAISEKTGEVLVGKIEFAGAKATVTELCLGKKDDSLCEVVATGGKFNKFLIHEEVVARRVKAKTDVEAAEKKDPKEVEPKKKS